MKTEKWIRAIGVMSGTSLDGLDLACCRFQQKEGAWTFVLEQTQTLSYSPEWKDRLSRAIELSEAEHQQLDLDYGDYLGERLSDFIQKNNLQPDLIGSHGHTSHHRPEEGITCQLGYGQRIANRIDLPVVSNFRQGDVALGGQGAPLVPIGDALLFSEFDACLNLGGIANISFENEAKERVAFDIGLANMGLNYLMQNETPPYDRDGREARTGKVDSGLLKELNSLAYFALKPPKSTGIEWFLSEIRPLLEKNSLSRPDLLRTLIEHMSQQIIEALPPTSKENNRLLVTGGGARNRFWMEQLADHLPSHFTLHIPQNTWIDFKEALVFAFMAVLRQRNQVNILKSVTGARQDSCGGDLFLPSAP